MDTDYKTRVEAGMAWLDSVKPGWERDIDLSTLDIKSGCDCVLGQVFACRVKKGFTGFAYGMALLPAGATFEHGFVEVVANYPALEAEWRTAIKARFDSGVLSDDVGPA